MRGHGKDLDRAAETLVEALFDADEWARWSRSPRRLAALLGTCSDGETALATTFIPLIDTLRGVPRTAPSPAFRTTRRDAMPDGEEDNRWKQEAAAGAREALQLLRIGLQEKKKKDKLSALTKAWEDTGRYKDALLQKYENGQVTDAKKAKAKAVREKLFRLQAMLRELHHKILDDEDPGNLPRQIDDLLNEILTDLILL